MEKKKIRVSLITLGCFKNIVDSEVLGGLLRKKGLEIIEPYEDADWVVINTCGFIRDAKEESIDEILRTLEKKENGEIKQVAIMGCLTERYMEDLKENFKTSDIVWGVNDIDELANAIADRSDVTYNRNNLFLYDEKYEREITTTPNMTYIKISEGCNMKCSFCAIPEIRGSFRSRTIESIVTEAQQLKQKGFEELNLISQNSTHFGKDRSNRSELPDLLEAISTVGFKWVRVLYLMPEEITDEILDGFDNPTILPYFDLPFQHVAGSLLNRMQRSGSTERHMGLIERIRAQYPEAIIRSTFIIGFPGETDAEFDELERFAHEAKIERIGVFGFSPEENTEAFDLEDKVDEEVIEERKERMMDVSDDNLERHNQAITGKEFEFIPLGPCPWDGEMTIGRISIQAPEVDGVTIVNRKFEEDYSIYWIRITGGEFDTLYGDPI